MKALVTGGNGFLGRHVVAALRTAGVEVRVIARRGEGTTGVEYLHADLTTSNELERAFDGIDVTIHLAASMRGSAAHIVSNTSESSVRLLRAMALSRTRRLVLASSFSVYDWSRIGQSVSEEDAILDATTMQAYDAYAQAKTLQEQLAREFARKHGWTLTILRPAVIWGSGIWGEFAIGKAIGKLQTVMAPNAAARLVYVENAADAFVCAAQRVDGGEVVLNVIDEPQVSAWRYARIAQRHTGRLPLPVPYSLGLLAAKVASGLAGGFRSVLPYFLQPKRFEALHKPVSWSNRRLRDTLAWSPRFTFEEGLARSEGRSG